MDRKRLEQLWEQATGLPDAETSPLSKAIITEALEGGGNGKTCEAGAASDAIARLARDCDNFSHTIGNA